MSDPIIRECHPELKPLLKEACRLWNLYRDFYSSMTEEGKIYCLPPSLVAEFEHLGEVLRAADPSMAEVGL